MLSKVTTAKHLQLFTAVPQMLYSSLHWKHLENKCGKIHKKQDTRKVCRRSHKCVWCAAARTANPSIIYLDLLGYYRQWPCHYEKPNSKLDHLSAWIGFTMFSSLQYLSRKGRSKNRPSNSWYILLALTDCTSGTSWQNQPIDQEQLQLLSSNCHTTETRRSISDYAQQTSTSETQLCINEGFSDTIHGNSEELRPVKMQAYTKREVCNDRI